MAKRIHRRRLLEILAGLPFVSGLAPSASAAAQPQARVRLGDPAWPSEESWNQLDHDVGGRLIKVRSPLSDCIGGTPDAACEQLFKELKNPYYLGDEVGLTQSLGWVGAWTSEPSVYAVAAKTTQDVVAAVNFARGHNLRLVIKGGGHSYQGSSNAADSLLIWTRHMNAIVTHDAFVGAGCEGRAEPQPAVSVEPGAIWGHVYNEMITKGGRYVQGGGCLTVGVAGLVLGGGFGSYSKAYGTAAGSLIEAEVVTADGEVRIANACTNPDLFWALKGGGGGFGVVTRVTLRTHALPEFMGGVFVTIKATSDDAYRRLISKTVEFYAEALFNSHWGEQILIGRGYVAISMVFQGLDQHEAEAVWKPFFDWVGAAPQDFSAEDRQRAGAPFLGPRRAQDGARPGHFGRSSRRAGRQYLLGEQPRRGGRGLARLPVRLAAGLAARSRPAPKPGGRAVRGGEAVRRGASFQQGTCGRDRGSRRHRKGYGDESGGHRRFRPCAQRRLGTARLPRRSRTRAGRGQGAKRGRGRRPIDG
jgi:FAD/FMN-containing dehydrogenase